MSGAELAVAVLGAIVLVAVLGTLVWSDYGTERTRATIRRAADQHHQARSDRW